MSRTARDVRRADKDAKQDAEREGNRDKQLEQVFYAVGYLRPDRADMRVLQDAILFILDRLERIPS